MRPVGAGADDWNWMEVFFGSPKCLVKLQRLRNDSSGRQVLELCRPVLDFSASFALFLLVGVYSYIMLYFCGNFLLVFYCFFRSNLCQMFFLTFFLGLCLACYDPFSYYLIVPLFQWRTACLFFETVVDICDFGCTLSGTCISARRSARLHYHHRHHCDCHDHLIIVECKPKGRRC